MEKIENTELEAKFVANKINELLNSNYMVFDKEQGYRKITYKDIVILLRATANMAPIYEKELESGYANSYANLLCLLDPVFKAEFDSKNAKVEKPAEE